MKERRREGFGGSFGFRYEHEQEHGGGGE